MKFEVQSDLNSTRRKDYMILPVHDRACQPIASLRWATCVDTRTGVLPCVLKPGATLPNLGNRRRNDERVRVKLLTWRA